MLVGYVKEWTKHESFLKRVFERSDTTETESLKIKQSDPSFAGILGFISQVRVHDFVTFQSQAFKTKVILDSETLIHPGQWQRCSYATF